MTDKEIIELAQKSKLHLATDVNWMPIISLEYAKKFAELVAAHEREACAKVCDKEQEFVASGGPYVFSARRCATNIRARGDK